MALPRPGRRGKWAVLALWAMLLALFWVYAQSLEGGAPGLLEAALTQVSVRWWGPLALLAAYLLRPLLLLPMTILTVFSGFLFGPLWGSVYALLASLASASVAYGAARLWGQRPRDPAGRGRGFEAVLTARLLFVPGDLINYVAGYLRTPFWAFLGATALGGTPGLLVGVLAGAALEGQFSFQGVRISPGYLLASGLILALSLGLARWLRSRGARETRSRGAGEKSGE